MRPSVEERFWSKVQRGPACWTWTGALNHSGYGLFRGPVRAAHRYSYQLAYGEIPAGQHVCHHCDNPACVRPDHLFLGDDAANHADMAAKRRSTWGERNRHAKLTADQVHAIRAARKRGELQAEIALRFGISRPTVSDICRGRSWRQLTES